MVKRVVFGTVESEGVAGLQDMNRRELVVLGTLAVAVLILGLWPAPLVEVMDASIVNLLQHISVSKL
ncbi:NADH-ubiquinone oxidoreductase chain M [endosymbiont of Riftia pachyptila (vent Ph05)]|uniref:NADH-ubiquinone oxidoreductase chain M n=4 Tax=sulfur-oxidizing symbionts TaxID=32036 RepID=G2DFU1_9GAMM|nr:NADH-ubiquinone oxidoreductase chain M [endosymbiont of Riftia pachyptila (vent Ph05)]